MSALKVALSMVSKGAGLSMARNGLFIQPSKLSPMLSATCLTMSGIQSRFLSSQDITKNIQYISKEKGVNLERDPKTFKLIHPREKPLCVMLNWMLAKQKHIHKYAQLYLEQGYDVLSVSCTPWQLLWPMKGSQLVAADLLRFLDANTDGGGTVVHGFSVGGYMWGEVCMLVSADRTKYQPVMDRIASQIWDSAADISEIQIGVPKAVFPKNMVMQNALRKYMQYHMKTFHESATIHYMRSSQQFHRTLVRAPALFLLSKSDPVGAESSCRRVHDSWKSMGIKVTWKCWEKSPHVQHFMHHQQEYMQAMSEHLSSCSRELLSKPEKMTMRV